MSISNPAFDEAEQEILSKLKPEGELPGSEPDGTAPTDAPAPSPAPAPGDAPAPSPAPEPSPTPAPTPAPTQSPAPSPAPTEPPAAPQGDVKAALRASRRSEQRVRQENERLKQELEQARQGKGAQNDEISDEELADLEANFPTQAKAVREVRAIKAQIESLKPALPADTEFEPVNYPPEVQAVIDEVPSLLAWQHDPKAQDKFARAIEYDKALLIDPDWKDKTASERFTEAARRTAALTPAAPATAPASPRLDPAAVIAAAPVATPGGISDFNGGAPPNQTRPNYAALSDEAIISSLKPED